MGALADPLVEVLFGAEWQPAAAVLRFLMIFTVVRMLISFSMDILAGAGATRSAFWVNVGWSVALVPALLVGTHRGGIDGAALIQAIVGVAVALPLTGVALRRVGVQLTPIARGVARPLLAGALMLAVCLLASLIPATPAVQLLVASVAGFVTYAATAVSPSELRQWMALWPWRRGAPSQPADQVAENGSAQDGRSVETSGRM
jgi:PST family polysaccharide transporter